MQRKFITNLFITLATNLLVKPFWIFGIDRVVQNKLGTEDYGAYANLFVFSLLLSVLLDFGINNYNTSTLASNPNKLQKQFVPLLFLKLFLGGVYILLTLFLGEWYGGYTDTQLWLLFVLSINQLLAYLSTFFRSTLSGLQQFKTEAFISASDRLIMSIAGIALILFATTSIQVETFIYVQTIGYAGAVLISFFTLFPYLHHISFRLSMPGIFFVFQKAFPYALLALLMMIYSRSDVIFLKKWMTNGDEENGIYAQGLRLVEAANMFGSMISGLLLPMFSALFRKKTQLVPLIETGLFVVLIPIISGVGFLVVYTFPVMNLLYDHTGAYSTEVFRWVMLTIIPIGVINIFGTLLTAHKSIRTLLITSLIGCVLNLGLNYLLIPTQGAWGSALAALVTQSVVAMVYLIVGTTQLKLNIEITYLFKYVIFAAGCILVLITAQYFDLTIEWALFFYLVCSACFVFLLKLINIHQLQATLTSYRKVQTKH